jgi:cation transport ATPase
MKKHGLGKLPHWQRWFTLVTLIVCAFSGIAYLLGHEFYISRALLGDRLVLITHGVASAIALIAFGTILPFHIKAGWKSRMNRISGISQLLFIGILIITAMLLYYGPEEIHDGSEVTHWVVGLIFFGVFLIHSVLRGIKSQ